MLFWALFCNILLQNWINNNDVDDQNLEGARVLLHPCLDPPLINVCGECVVYSYKTSWAVRSSGLHQSLLTAANKEYLHWVKNSPESRQGWVQIQSQERGGYRHLRARRVSNAVPSCSVENQKGAIAVQSLWWYCPFGFQQNIVEHH